MRGPAMTTTTVRRWLVWIPVLMMASLLYWTVALGLGGMSLMAMSALSQDRDPGSFVGSTATMGGDTDTAEATGPRDGYEPIVVHLEESVEPEDVDDNPGCGLAGGTSATGDADGTPVPTGQSGVGIY
jgi:hypothetical protein